MNSRWVGCLLILWLLGGNEVMRACSCLQPPAPSVAAEESDLVFSGRVLSIEKSDPTDFFSFLDVEFEVIEAFKGTEESSRVRILTGPDSAVCGYRFEHGNSYLVYARGGGREYWTGICDRTQSLDRAGSDIRTLRARPSNVVLGVEIGVAGLEFFVMGGQSRVFQLEGTIDFETWAPMLQVAPDSDTYRVPERVASTDDERFFRLREEEPMQGVFGLTLFLPGACLEDPERPGECLNLPYPGSSSYDVRPFSDTPDLGRENPIVQSFQSSEGAGAIFVSPSHVADLDGATVSDSLRAELLGKGIDLSASVEVQVRREGRSWVVVDLSVQEVFFVSNETQSLQLVRTGSFRVPLPEGDYCVWSFFGCDRQVNVTAGKWQFLLMSVPLP